MLWPPHPPPPAEWEDWVKETYRQGCARIDRLRAANYGGDGVMTIPFLCCGCDKWRDDLAMTTGDGLPMCVECLGFKPWELEGINDGRRPG